MPFILLQPVASANKSVHIHFRGKHFHPGARYRWLGSAELVLQTFL